MERVQPKWKTSLATFIHLAVSLSSGQTTAPQSLSNKHSTHKSHYWHTSYTRCDVRSAISSEVVNGMQPQSLKPHCQSTVGLTTTSPLPPWLLPGVLPLGTSFVLALAGAGLATSSNVLVATIKSSGSILVLSPPLCSRQCRSSST
jgi:hypothetical protein